VFFFFFKLNQNLILNFKLKAIWKRDEISQYSLMNAKSLKDAFFMKFILADKFLCMTSNGKLYSSSNKSEECLWSVNGSKFFSVIYNNKNIVVKKNCKLNVVRKNFDFDQIEEDSNQECSERLSVTSGFSPQLQNFYMNCQSSLQKNQNITKNSASSLSQHNKNILPHLNVEKAETLPVTQQKTSKNKARKMKCFQFRKTSKYKECMNRYYKCFKFRKNATNFKNCRKRLRKLV
jgi:hypothetical protein